MPTYHIHISGRVQGVGFRPSVFRLAHQMKLSGWVNNATDGVHIEVNSDETRVNEFVDRIVKGAPLHSKIESCIIKIIAPLSFTGFVILESTKGSKEVRLTPDFAMCTQCEYELLDKSNSRYFYPFITCTECGPRYSIQKDTPYDRASTSMKPFEMCDACSKEYGDPTDIRFYSQTNSCEKCGVELSLYDSYGKKINAVLPIQIIANTIMKGKIVAVKGIGGYVLMCDATNEEAIQLLRKRKKRPAKPFALLYSDIGSLQEDANVKEEEINLLNSTAAPIVLVEMKTEVGSRLKTKVIAPNLGKLGVMIPYAPLFKLIAEAVSRPLIATSGNLSGTPITYQNDEAIRRLGVFADIIVTNNRDIIIPQDDSVTQWVNGKLNHIRRARGYAPTYFGTIPNSQMDGVIALGADIKSSVAISQSKQWYVSQFLGNQGFFESQQTYEKVLSHLIHLSGAQPAVVLVDNHPNYFTSLLGKSLSEEQGIPVESIQHHEAHFAAVLQENDLIDNVSPVLGVIWDGTGYGHDGNNWGGEFFRYCNNVIDRICHLNYVPALVGDKMAREPRLAALVFCYDLLDYADKVLRLKFSKAEFDLYKKMLIKPQLFTSSIGRLFDAVASLLGLSDKSSYEGEAAMYLQSLAATDRSGDTSVYGMTMDDHTISTMLMIQEILHEVNEGVPAHRIAMKFHCTLVEMIKMVARKSGYHQIAFSGGVFQNSLLVELIEERLTNFNLYFHKELPANDENISFGQLAHYHMSQTKVKQNETGI